MNFIDTAPAYGLGLSEEIVGKAIAGRRDKAVIATKCGLQWHAQQGTFFFNEYGKSIYKWLDPGSIHYEVEQNLKRLNTDYIDLYQTHWQDPTTPIEDTMKALLDLKDQGKIRAIGVSNANAAQLEEYRNYGVVDTDQELFSMLDRKIETELLPYCREHNIAMLAYSPLVQGLLTGNVTPDREFAKDDLRGHSSRFSVENRLRIMDMLAKFQPVADKYNITLAQLVIAWTIAQPGVTHALVGARNAEQAKENAGAGDVTVSQDELATMDQAIAEYQETVAASKV